MDQDDRALGMDEEGEELEAATRDDSPWIVCPVCNGEGTTVNPDIDAGGLSARDFDEDPDFREDYMAGVYDIPCRCCNGRTTVRQSHADGLAERAAERRLAAREDGDFEAYLVAGDYRYG